MARYYFVEDFCQPMNKKGLELAVISELFIGNTSKKLN